MRFKRSGKWHSAISIIILPSSPFIPFIFFIKLRKWQRIYADFITSVSKLSQYIWRQHLRITTGNIHICIIHMHKSKDYIDKCYPGILIIHVRIPDLRYKLNLIDENVISLVRINHMITHVFIQFQWITIPGIFQYIQCQGNDLVFLHTFSQKPFPIQPKQQYRFSASAKSRDDLNTSIILLWNNLFQILFSRIHLHTSRFICGYPHLFHV